jgi:hypothetical protein
LDGSNQDRGRNIIDVQAFSKTPFINQSSANRKGETFGIFGAEAYQDLERRRKGIERNRFRPPGFRQRDKGRNAIVCRGTVRKAGKDVQQEVKAIPGRPPLVYPDEGPQGGPAVKFFPGGSEPVQDDPVPGTTKFFFLIDDIVRGHLRNQRGKLFLPFPEIFRGYKEPGILTPGTEFPDQGGGTNQMSPSPARAIGGNHKDAGHAICSKQAIVKGAGPAAGLPTIFR